MIDIKVYGLHTSKFKTTLEFIINSDKAQTRLYIRKNKRRNYEL